MRFLFVLFILMSPLVAHSQAAKQGVLVSAASMGANVTSVGIDYLSYPIGSVQAVYTGSPVGELKLQISSDNTNDAGSVVNWSDYTPSIYAISAAGDTEYILTGIGYRWLRLVYTRTSGSGVLNATWTRKAGN